MLDRLSKLVIVGLVTAALLATAPGWAKAQDSPLPAEARQFDFWLGRWNVAIAGGGQATNTITPFGLGGGIALLEDYAQGPYRGTSVSYYSAREGQWRQLWLDSQGGLLEFAGGLDGDRFSIFGHVGGTLTRLVYFNITDRSLDQSYDQSINGGATWIVSFAARYTRRGTSSRDPSPAPRDSEAARGALPPAARQFDFWLGDWNVNAGPDVLANGSITTYGVGGGIAILHDLTSETGYRATSVAVYHPQDRIWNLVSLDSDGVLMDLSGGLRSGTMVLEGTIVDPQSGVDAMARMTFDRESGARIDQIVEVSHDDGATWEVRRVDRYARGALAAPGNLRATKVKKKKVVLGWDDLTSSEAMFEVLRRDGDEWVVVAELGPDATSATVKRLDRRTAYTFGVRACDAFGCSEPAEVEVTTR